MAQQLDTPSTFYTGTIHMSAITDITVLDVENDGSTAQLTLTRQSDGAIRFEALDGFTYYLRSEEATKLFAAIEALV